MKPYLDWIKSEALPLWAERGFDPRAGRFVERLDPAAAPLPVPHRAMVQARQIYVYAHAAALGWFPEGGALAEQAMASLQRDFCETRDGATSLAFAIDPASGVVSASARDSYTHAFVLFALAQLHRLNGDPALLALADAITRYIEADLIDPHHGGVVDVQPRTAATKRQNPQMHLLEAYLALDATAPGRGYDARAADLVDLFHARLFSDAHGVLLEHFSDDWSAHPEARMAMLFEPGHHYEWIWLLHQHEGASRRDHRPVRARLDAAARGHGHAPNGLIFDEVSADRAVLKPSFRLWPHTEAIKAAAVRHQEGDAGAADDARALSALLLTHFLGRPFAGGWTDQLAPNLTATVDYVPASSLYHLMLAAAEAERVLSGA